MAYASSLEVQPNVLPQPQILRARAAFQQDAHACHSGLAEKGSRGTGGPPASSQAGSARRRAPPAGGTGLRRQHVINVPRHCNLVHPKMVWPSRPGFQGAPNCSDVITRHVISAPHAGGELDMRRHGRLVTLSLLYALKIPVAVLLGEPSKHPFRISHRGRQVDVDRMPRQVFEHGAHSIGIGGSFSSRRSRWLKPSRYVARMISFRLRAAASAGSMRSIDDKPLR